MIPDTYQVIGTPADVKSWGTCVYIPEAHARKQQWWCHTIIDYYEKNNADKAVRSFYKKLLKELYRKEYYEQHGWEDKFVFFVCLGVIVVECNETARIYHDIFSSKKHPKGQMVIMPMPQRFPTRQEVAEMFPIHNERR